MIIIIIIIIIVITIIITVYSQLNQKRKGDKRNYSFLVFQNKKRMF